MGYTTKQTIGCPGHGAELIGTEFNMSDQTDKERLQELLDDFGVGYDPEIDGDEDGLTCGAGSDKIGGHIGFFAEFVFDEKGKFLNMRVWE